MPYENLGQRPPKRGTADDVYEREAKRYKLLTGEEERALARRARAGDTAARDAMVQSNLRLVLHMARRYYGRGLPQEDIIQHGNMGLLTAVGKFDPGRGLKFSTYAVWWIRQAIQAALLDTARVVRVPRNRFDILGDVQRATEALRQEMKREPKIADIAEKIGERPDRLAELIRGVKSLKAVSLDASVGRPEFGREGSLGETIEAAQEARPDLSTAEMETLLQPLRPKQRYIVLRRYGLDGQPAATLQEISRRLGLSRERVRQLQADAIRRLRDRATRMLEPGTEDPGIMPGRRRLDVRALIAGISTDPQDILPAPKLKQQPARGGRAEWNEMFEALHDYKRRTGHCRVPRNYWPDLRLANWVVAQKAKCRRGDLSERRMRLLVSIGFSWLSPRALAESMLARLEAFHAEHGHSRVPDAHPFTDLHAWCKSLKRAWMSPARLRRLERIGFPWEAVSETKSS